MIHPNEIRIGNWYHMENRGYFQWEYPHFDDYIKDKSSGWNVEGSVVSDKVEPIPLTAEILEKAEFVKNIDHYELHHRALTAACLKATSYDGYWSVYLHAANWQYSTRVGSVHQLQNLYFALTGEELTINFKDLTYQ